MRERKNNSAIFTQAQNELIIKFSKYFKFDLGEVENEAWLVCFDISSDGRSDNDFEAMLWSRLREIHKSSYLGHHIFASDLLPDETGDYGLARKLEIEALIDSLPADSLAAAAIEKVSGLAHCLEFAENQGMARRSGQRFFDTLLLESRHADLFSEHRIEDWKAPRKFKKNTECPNLIFEPKEGANTFFGTLRFSPPPVEKNKTVLPIAQLKKKAQISKVEQPKIEQQPDLFRKAA